MFRIIVAFIAGAALGASINAINSQSDTNNEDGSKKQPLPMNAIREKRYRDNLVLLEEAFKHQGQLRNKEVTQLLGVSPKTARNYFNELVRRGVITKTGQSGRGVHYKLNR